jgi:hypothetical protein
MYASSGPIVLALDGRWVWSFRWNRNLEGETKYLEKLALVPLRPPQIPHGLTWDQTRAVKGRLGYGMTKHRHYVLQFMNVSNNIDKSKI